MSLCWFGYGATSFSVEMITVTEPEAVPVELEHVRVYVVVLCGVRVCEPEACLAPFQSLCTGDDDATHPSSASVELQVMVVDPPLFITTGVASIVMVGSGTRTVTVADDESGGPKPRQSRVYVVVMTGVTVTLPDGIVTLPIPWFMEQELNPIVSHERVEEDTFLIIAAGNAVKLMILDGGTFTVTFALFSAASEPLSTMTLAVYVPLEEYAHVVLFVVADSPSNLASHGDVMFVPPSERLQ